MANPFDVQVPNAAQGLDAFGSGFSGIRRLMQERTISTARDEAAREMMRGGNPKSAIARLIGVGDIQGASTIANMGTNERDFAFRQQEAQRQQGNTDRSFKLQEKQAEEKPQYMKDELGNIVEIQPFGRGARVITPTGGSGPSNPFFTGKMTESQSKDAVYTSRMINAEKILNDPKTVEAATSLKQQAMSKVPVAGNYMVSKEFQNYDQAQRDFINAVLRRESGAVISDAEFENARKQYFPQPGDSKERIEQKRQNRIESIRGIGAGAGPSYRPPATIQSQPDIPPPRQAAPQGGPVRVNSPAERDALPPGTPYIAPDGSIRTKK